MAIDNTPPRLKLIMTIAVITVITLIGIDFVLKSYYGYMTEDAQRGKLAPTAARDEQHKAEAAALAGAAMPLDQAMAQLAKGTRTDLVTPEPSDDVGPLTGWSKMPKPAPAAHGGAAPAPHTTTTATAGDAGAPHATGDAGAPHAAVAADAGAPKKAPAPAADAGAKPKAPAAPKDAGAAAPKGAPTP